MAVEITDAMVERAWACFSPEHIGHVASMRLSRRDIRKALKAALTEPGDVGEVRAAMYQAGLEIGLYLNQGQIDTLWAAGQAAARAPVVERGPRRRNHIHFRHTDVDDKNPSALRLHLQEHRRRDDPQ